MKNPKRITIVTGHFGSGKTEFSLNYAIRLKKMGKRVVIVDFDIVNPYFRTKDAEEVLNQKGINVISPGFANMNIETPALPPEINSVFENKDVYVVFDVGGDDDGAIPLGRYYSRFTAEPYDMFFVFNERRVITATAEEALEILHDIETVSRLKVNGIVNNTHLKEFTTPKILLSGQTEAEKLCEMSGVPLAYISGRRDVINQPQIQEKYKEIGFPMDLFINLKF